MSRAFVKESDAEVELPERAVSAHRNLVTTTGLALIDGTIRRLEASLAEARRATDKATIANCQRDLRYWHKRRATAELIPPATGAGRVRFGSTVTILLDDGTERRLRIVGEDEADPAAGTIAYLAPVAAAMIGAKPGDRVATGSGEGEILEVG